MKYVWLICITFLATAAVAQNPFVYTNDNVSTGINNNPVNPVSAFKVAAPLLQFPVLLKLLARTLLSTSAYCLV